MRVVIDTNCLVASVPPKGGYYWLYDAFEAEQFEWLISNEILTEYIEKLAELYSEQTALLVYSIISTAENVTFTEPFFKWQLVEADPDDNKFADLAPGRECGLPGNERQAFQSFKNTRFSEAYNRFTR